MYSDNNRLLLKVELEPVQGKRFQPTGFPDLGAAEIQLSTGSRSLLVESAQSMANRLELVCLNKKGADFSESLRGLTMVKVIDKHGNHLTNSVLEAHRICSNYIIQDSTITEILVDLQKKYHNGVNIQETAKVLFGLDINSLIHGIWASQIKPGGRIKIPRALSAFIEADNVNDVISGGVKFDNINPSKDELAGGAEKGQGHIPFPRIEYTSDSIHAYFNLDLEQIRNYGLDENQTDLLINIALWKIRTFLEKGLRLRTACDLKIKGDIVSESDGFVLPDKATLDSKVKELIVKCKNDLPASTTITYKK